MQQPYNINLSYTTKYYLHHCNLVRILNPKQGYNYAKFENSNVKAAV